MSERERERGERVKEWTMIRRIRMLKTIKTREESMQAPIAKNYSIFLTINDTFIFIPVSFSLTALPLSQGIHFLYIRNDLCFSLKRVTR